ncbi:conserved hypothetical protein [Xanthomonas citri pv. citri]|nr:conserved hypothetical protein [Xanthomonas citri pv. citri]
MPAIAFKMSVTPKEGTDSQHTVTRAGKTMLYCQIRQAHDAGRIRLLQRQARLVHRHARTHGRADRHLLQVGTLGGGRLGLDQIQQQRLQVRLQRFVVEAGLADGAVDDAGLVGAVAHLARLGILDRFARIGRHGADLRVRHQAARTQQGAQLTDDAHGVRGRDDHVIVQVAGLHLLGQVVHAHGLGTSGQGFVSLGACRCEHCNAHALAGTGRQHGGTAHLLVGLLGVHAQAHGNVDRLDELGLGGGLQDLDCVFEGIGLARNDSGRNGLNALALCHVLALHRQTHAAGRTRNRAHRRFQLGCRQIGFLDLGDLFQLLARHLAHLVGVGTLRAGAHACGLLEQHAGRSALGDEREGTVGIRGDDHRRRQTRLQLRRCRVECLAEFHDVQTALTQCRANRRRRVGLTGLDLQLDESGNLLSHFNTLRVLAPDLQAPHRTGIHVSRLHVC